MEQILQDKLTEFEYSLPAQSDDDRRKAYIAFLKHYLSAEKDVIFQAHRAGASGWEILSRHSELTDAVIQNVYRLVLLNEQTKGKDPGSLAILAAGGYGRRELHPFSDIDLIFLYDGEMTEEMCDIATSVLHFLWDMGLDLGHVLRSVDDCMLHASQDIASQTSIMDSRILAGNTGTFAHMQSILHETIIRHNTDSYIQQKLKEMKVRHKQYGESIYNLQPNIKNGVGGLRDIHTALWLAQARFGTRDLDDLHEIGVISKKEKKETESKLDFLWRLRNELHYTAQRKQDILSFQFQESVAANLGFIEDAQGNPIEHLMREFYRSARHIEEYSQVIIDRCFPLRSHKNIIREEDCELVPGLYQKERHLHLLEQGQQRINPALIVRCFLESQRRNVAISLSTRTLIRNRLPLLKNEEFLAEEPLSLFLRMLEETGNLAMALREMHEVRLLEKFIPEFRGLYCLVRHDLQHRYTVDEHTLRLIMYLQQLKNQTSLEKDIEATPPKELVQVYHEVKEHKVLMLTALLHDIGKVAKTNHVEAGLMMIPHILERLKLSPEDTRKILSLVAIHHLMSEVSQHHDLEDKKILEDFARQVGSEVKLKMLYCITYADMRSVSEEVWTPWKSMLLSELYHKAKAILSGEPLRAENEKSYIFDIRQKVKSLSPASLTEKDIEEHFTGMSPRYLMGTSPEQICLHLTIVKELLERPLVVHWGKLSGEEDIVPEDIPLITTIEHFPKLKYSQFTVFTLDMPGLFSKIAGALASKGLSILWAQIFTRADGVVIDTFQLDIQSPGWTEEEFVWKDLEAELKEILVGKKDISAIISARQQRQDSQTAQPVIIETDISISDDISDTHTVIDVRTRDRIGLLYTLTHTLAKLKLSIASARIATYGMRAVDVFYVTDWDGEKIKKPETLIEIKKALTEALD
jgi:[protein-PII] uridylyltransferase